MYKWQNEEQIHLLLPQIIINHGATLTVFQRKHNMLALLCIPVVTCRPYAVACTHVCIHMCRRWFVFISIEVHFKDFSV